MYKELITPELIQFITLILVYVGISWKLRAESREDWKIAREDWKRSDDQIKAINDKFNKDMKEFNDRFSKETKDFHQRLCSIEERRLNNAK